MAKKSGRLPCAVLGATGMVGQRFVQLLEGHPTFEATALCASDKRVGKSYGDTVKWVLEGRVPQNASRLKVVGLDADTVARSGARVAFSALPSDVAVELERELAARGIWVFSNTASHRMDPDVPLLVPEVNAEHLDLVKAQATPGKVVTNANCSTTGLVLVLAPLRVFGIRRVVVSTYQAISGAGYPGVASLDINANVIPYIGGEEEKMVRETRKMLGPLAGGRVADHPLEVVASCARVPVRDGHLETAAIEFERAVAPERIIRALRGFVGAREVRGLPSSPERPVIYFDEPDRPQPIRDVWAGGEGRRAGMSACAGRLAVSGSWARLFLLSHNTVRGAAGGSLQNAELAVARGYLKA